MTQIKKIRACLLLPLLLAAKLACADGMSNVKAFYQQTKSVRADFHQVVTDRQGRKIQEVDGQMQLKRPNKFKWDYDKPYQQQIISDGQQVWLYDVDLAQVTVNTLRQTVGSSPAALLAGDANIDKSFRLSNASRKDDLEWVSASPKDKESGFDKILMGFKDNKIQALSLIDSFGHTTNITFSNVELNPMLDEKNFLFKPPAGVDVVGE